MDHVARPSLLVTLYQEYLREKNAANFVAAVERRYTTSTLARLVRSADRITRRAAVLALGMIGDYESNAVMGAALADPDRGVRTLAENGIRLIWHRAGNEHQRQRLTTVMQLIGVRHYVDAVRQATELIGHAPWFAEVWNQRAIAQHHLGRYSESIRDCRQALEINPYHFGAAAGMGQSYLKLNNPAAALECFRRALRLNPNLEGVRAQVVYLQRTMKEE